MSDLNIFISVGGTANEKQEFFIRGIEDRLRSENLIPNTVGRNKFSADSPLKTVISLMDDCQGTIIIALERTYLISGKEKRGGEKETELTDIKYATPWNQIEAAIAYSKKQPIIVLVEEGLKDEGLLEKGYDWYVMTVKPELSFLTTPEFNGVLSSWKKKVEGYKINNSARTTVDPYKMTLKDLFTALRPSTLWAILGAIASITIGAFALGQLIKQITFK